MKRQRTTWTKQQRDEFIAWHEQRMKDLGYPPEVVKELVDARKTWLSKVRTE